MGLMTLNACAQNAFVGIQGPNLIKPNGDKLFIKGTNLGNWLNPEGYMFGFSKTNSGWMIDLLLKEMVGPEETASFWAEFKENYITAEDIRFIAQQGANTIRMPFHYKLFTTEDFMGNPSPLQNGECEGFKYMDRVIGWCRDNGLYLILDMHDCPGGQTGDNIDDSYGYPWLIESEGLQQQFCQIWQMIAQRYKDEPVILGYELMNEAIPHYMSNKAELKPLLEKLYRRGVEAIRKVDNNHIILIGGAEWNSNFDCITDWSYDDKIMFTCHRYGGDALKEAIGGFTEFRDRTNRPMYMGEIGHNTMEWQTKFSQVMQECNIGYTFWPYKKVDDSCMNGVVRPENWDSLVVKFSETDRTTYKQMQDERPDMKQVRMVLRQYLENIKFANCVPQKSYIESMKLK